MRKDYLKYLSIPTLVCILYATMIISIYAYTFHLIDFNISDEYKHFMLLNTIINKLSLLPAIFVAILIFTIAYKLTQLTLKNIIYILLISIIIVLTDLIIGYALSYISQIIYTHMTLHYRYVISLMSSYPTVYVLIITLIIMGVSTLYMKLTKSSITTITNQHICLLYASLFIALVIKDFGSIVTVLQTEVISLPTFFYILIASIMISAIYFIYCYTWTKQALHVNKITINYPIKAISSCLLTILLLFIIGITLHIGILKLFDNMTNSGLKTVIKAFSVISYLFATIMFFIIIFYSKSLLYRLVHTAYYLLVAIILMITLNITIRSDYANPAEIPTAFGYIYGTLIFGVSLSLCLMHLCNKLSICLFFRNKQQAN